MKVYFIGTKGEIEAFSKRHFYQTATLFIYKGTRLLIDYGGNLNNTGKLATEIKPDYIIVTHAHPDHYGDELRKYPIYTSAKTHRILSDKDYPTIPLKEETPYQFGQISLLFRYITHSIKAPNISIKLNNNIVINTDIAIIPRYKEWLRDIKAYIGDGSYIKKSLIRRHKVTKELFGHKSIKDQLAMLRLAMSNPNVIAFTHFGTEAVKMDHDKLVDTVYKLALDQNFRIKPFIAIDGSSLTIPY